MKFFKILVIISTLLIASSLTLIYNQNMVYEINGSSMNPTIENGDYVRCADSDQNYSQGDIIAYNEQNINYTVIHRITKVLDKDSYRTKGDNNKYRDNYIVNDSEIICKIN